MQHECAPNAPLFPVFQKLSEQRVVGGSSSSCKHLASITSLAQLQANTGLTIPHYHRPPPAQASKGTLPPAF